MSFYLKNKDFSISEVQNNTHFILPPPAIDHNKNKALCSSGNPEAKMYQ